MGRAGRQAGLSRGHWESRPGAQRLGAGGAAVGGHHTQGGSGPCPCCGGDVPGGRRPQSWRRLEEGSGCPHLAPCDVFDLKTQNTLMCQ